MCVRVSLILTGEISCAAKGAATHSALCSPRLCLLVVKRLQKLLRTRRGQGAGKRLAEPRRVGGRTLDRLGDALSAVKRQHCAVEPDGLTAADTLAAGRKRHVAAALEAAQQPSLRLGILLRGRVVEEGEHFVANPGIVRAALDGQHALCHGVHVLVLGKHLRDAGGVLVRLHAQQPGVRQDGGVVSVVPVVELGQAGADVAADVLEHKVGVLVREHGTAPQRGGADHGACRQVLDGAHRSLKVLAGNEDVFARMPLQVGADAEPVGEGCLQVFARVHGDVDFLVVHLHLQLLCEQTLVADLRQGFVQHLVAFCFCRNDLEGQVRPRLGELVNDVVCLDHGKG
eukprot:Rhum_TRINITY_DN2566_c0_g1::Rhum_TRINITY_DN2566_c0_g1_i1::g.7581::m.7581